MRVMIVEDQTMIRSLLESYFRAEDGYRITASIPGAKQAVEVCRTSSVDLILMDVQTENRENGLTAVRQIKAIQPKSKIIVVTSLIDCAVLDEAKRAGADSLWYKDSTQKRLMDVVRQTMAGEHSLAMGGLGRSEPHVVHQQKCRTTERKTGHQHTENAKFHPKRDLKRESKAAAASCSRRSNVQNIPETSS